MDELTFTWKTALKLFAGLILLGAWLMTRQQSQLDKQDSEARQQARKAGTPEPRQRIIPRSNLAIAAAAVIFIIISLLWGNESTL